VKLVDEMETKFVAICALTIVKDPGADSTSVEEIAEEMVLFS
jgi:hypothetical protein